MKLPLDLFEHCATLVERSIGKELMASGGVGVPGQLADGDPEHDEDAAVAGAPAGMAPAVDQLDVGEPVESASQNAD